MFLLEELPPWHSNRLSRLIKTAKLHLGDTGLACALLGVDVAALAAEWSLPDPLLETFAFQELRRLAAMLYLEVTVSPRNSSNFVRRLAIAAMVQVVGLQGRLRPASR